MLVKRVAVSARYRGAAKPKQVRAGVEALAAEVTAALRLSLQAGEEAAQGELEGAALHPEKVLAGAGETPVVIRRRAWVAMVRAERVAQLAMRRVATVHLY